MINPSELTLAGGINSFKNYQASTFYTTIAAQTLTAGHFVSATASTPLNNANSVSQVQLQYWGLSTRTYIIYGTENTFWSGGNYEVESIYYFDSTNLNVFTVVANQTGGSISIPEITIYCRGFLFLAPFT